MVYDYFSVNSLLRDEYEDTPSIDKETSYYEISEYSVAGIKNVMRYYPATQKIMLLRGYSKSESMAEGYLMTSDEYSLGISINLSKKTITALRTFILKWQQNC